MCGICGQFGFGLHSELPNVTEWRPLIQMMSRRGPDDQGIWHDERCLMGFRRLAIIDLSPAANQPFISPDERYALVFNGELYNFSELASELTHQVQFGTRGDAEVVLHSLMTWGAKALSRFNGMYALAFYDKVEQTLLLARDHVGMKPLYFLSDATGVVFASQYDQIARHRKARGRSFSIEDVATYLRIGYIPAPGALLQGTEMVEPGSWVSFSSAGKVTRGRVFEFQPESGPVLSGPDADEAIADALGRSLRRHIVSDAPVGCFLSGGVDSTLIASVWRKVDPDRVIPAFTIGRPDSAFDESDEARTHADAIGLQLHLENLSDHEAESLIDDVFEASTEPLADPGIFPSLMVSRMAAKKVKVVLSGEGADELFWGYVGRQCPFLKNVAYGNGDRSLQKYSSWLTDIRPEEFESCFPVMPFSPLGSQAADRESYSDIARAASEMRRYEIQTYLPFILLKTDRASMFHSLEVRLPFLDKEVIEVASRIRWDSCLDLDRGGGKQPLRKLLANSGIYPSLPKRGFGAPIDRWLRGCLSSRISDCLEGIEVLAGIPVNRKSITKLWSAFQSGQNPRGAVFWRLLLLCEWVRRNI